MNKKTASELLSYVLPLLIYYLEELSTVSASDANQFLYGEKTAYAECLEWLQQCEYAENYGLDFDIEQRFPL